MCCFKIANHFGFDSEKGSSIGCARLYHVATAYPRAVRISIETYHTTKRKLGQACMRDTRLRIGTYHGEK
eukprot:6179730-Pleurochrysis_carterae.AAC.1